jgi:hypothetical protein
MYTQEAADSVLALLLIEKMSVEGTPQEPLKLQKAAFEAALRMREANLLGFTLHFFRYRHGTLSKDFYGLIDKLMDLGLVAKVSVLAEPLEGHRSYELKAVVVSDRGHAILGELSELLSSGVNADICRIVEEAAGIISPMTASQAKEHNHSTFVQLRDGERRRVHDFPEKTDLLEPIEPEKAVGVFDVSSEWSDTIDMMFSPAYNPASMRRSSGLTFEELFSGV